MADSGSNKLWRGSQSNAKVERLSSVFFSSSPKKPRGSRRDLFKRLSFWRGESNGTRRASNYEAKITPSSKPRRSIRNKIIPFSAVGSSRASSILHEIEGGGDINRNLVLLPRSQGRKALDICYFLLCVASLLCSPMLLLFLPSDSEFGSQILSSIASIGVWVIDAGFIVYLYLMLFHVLPANGPYSFWHGLVCVNYVNSFSCVVDVLMALPMMSIGLATARRGLVVAGGVLRMFLGVRVERVLQQIGMAFSGNHAVKLGLLLARIVFLSYLLSGGFYLISLRSFANGGIEEMQKNVGNAVSPFEFNEGSFQSDFLSAFYFTIQTLFTVGYGDVIPLSMSQIRFVLCCFLFGTMVRALVISQITSLLKNLDVTGTEFKEKMELISQYLHVRHISKKNRDKVQEYFAFLWDRQRGRLESSILQSIPPRLREKINSGRRNALLNVRMFQGRDMVFVDSIVAALQPEIINFGDFLCVRNDPVECMWLLAEGRLEVLSPGEGDGYTAGRGLSSNPSRRRSVFQRGRSSLTFTKQPSRKVVDSQGPCEVIEVIVPGESGYYGEQALFSRNQRHRYSVLAARTCELQRLDTEVFQSVMEVFLVGLSSEMDDTADFTPMNSVEKFQSSSGDSTSVLAAQDMITHPVPLRQRRMSASQEYIKDIQQALQLRPVLNNSSDKNMLQPTSEMVSVIDSSNEPSSTSSPAPEGSNKGKRDTVQRRRRSAIKFGSQRILHAIPPRIVAPSLDSFDEVKSLTTDPGVLATVQAWFERDSVRQRKLQAPLRQRTSFLSLLGKTTKGEEVDPLCTRLFSGLLKRVNYSGMRIVALLSSPLANRVWDRSLLLGTLYLCIATPLYIVFVDDSKKFRFVVQLSWVLDLFVDMIVVFSYLLREPFAANSMVSSRYVNTSSHGTKAKAALKNVELHQQRRTISENLALRGPLSVTVYSLMFASWLCGYVWLVTVSADKFHLFRIPTVLLIYQLATESLPKVASQFNFFRRLGALQIVVIQITTVIVLVAHWMTCIWIRLEEGNPVIFKSSDQPFGTTYTRCWYWVLVTFSTVGFGDITPTSDISRAFCIFTIVFGVTLYAGVLSILAAITRNSDASPANVEHFGECCKHYLSNKALPRKLVADCLAYLEYAAANYQRLEEGHTLGETLPGSLQECILTEILRDRFLSNSLLFKDSPSELLALIGLAMKKEVFPPGYLITCGYTPAGIKTPNVSIHDRGVPDVYIYLEFGEAEILSSTDQVIGKLEQGRGFAPIALFDASKQEQKLRAVQFCEVWTLSKAGFRAALDQFESKMAASSARRTQTSSTSVTSSKEDWGTRVYQEARLYERAKELSQNVGKIAKNLKNAKLNKLIMCEEGPEDELVKLDKGVIPPLSRFQRAWDLTVMMTTCYNLAFASYRLGLGYGELSTGLPLMALDILGDLIYLFDIILRLRYFAIELNGTIEGRRAVFAKNYIRGIFKWDVLAGLPIALLTALIVGVKTLKLPIYGLLRINTFFKLHRFDHWIRTLTEVSPIRKDLTTLVALLLSILLSAHVSGCFFFLMARLNLGAGITETWATNSSDYVLLVPRVENGTVVDFEPQNRAYVRSVYWAMATLTSVGYGDYSAVTDNEILYTIVLLIGGGFLYALILNNLEEIIANSDISSILFQRKFDSVSAYLRYRDVPPHVSNKVVGYYNSQWVRQKGVEEAWIQEHLPLPLRRWLREEALGQRKLDKLPLFKDWDCIELFLDLLQPVTCLEDTMVFEAEELIFKLFFVCSGKVEYMSSDKSRVFTSFTSGDSFGEIQFFFAEPTQCAARTKELTDLLVLHRVEFDLFLQEHSDLAERFRKDIVELEAGIRKRCSLETFTKNLGREKINKFFTEEVKEEKGGVLRGTRLIFPSHPFRRVWDMVMMLNVVYMIFTIPYRATFYRNSALSSAWSSKPSSEFNFASSDVLTDLILLLDVLARMLLFTANDRGVVLFTRKEVVRHHIKTRLFFDLLMLLPLDYFVLAQVFILPMQGSIGIPALVALFRTPRLICGFRFPYLLSSVQDFLAENGLIISSGYKQILRIIMVGFTSVHLIACVKSTLSFRYLEKLPVDYSPSDAYQICLYWALYTIFTIGYGNIPVDAPAFAIMCMVFGAFLCDAGVTATLSNIYANQDAKVSEAKRRRVALVQYLKTHHINSKVKDDVLGFIDYQRDALQNLNEEEITHGSNLPWVYRKEIVLSAVLEAVPNLDRHPLFAGFSPGLIQTMALMLTPVLFPKNQIILNATSETEDSVNGSYMQLAQQAKMRSMKHSSGKSHSGKAKLQSSKSTQSSKNLSGKGMRLDSSRPASMSLSFYRSANLDEPGLSMFHASFANVGTRRFPIDEEQENIYFLTRGAVLVATDKREAAKVIRRGIISKSSGIDSARTLSHCEAFVLDIHQYNVLSQYGGRFGNRFETFAELLDDEIAFAFVELFVKKNRDGTNSSDLKFWKLHKQYVANPTPELAKEIYQSYLGTLTRKQSKMDLEDETIDEIQSRLKDGDPNLFAEVASTVYQRLDHSVKPRFLASLEYANLWDAWKHHTSTSNERCSSGQALGVSLTVRNAVEVSPDLSRKRQSSMTINKIPELARERVTRVVGSSSPRKQDASSKATRGLATTAEESLEEGEEDDDYEEDARGVAQEADEDLGVGPELLGQLKQIPQERRSTEMDSCQVLPRQDSSLSVFLDEIEEEVNAPEKLAEEETSTLLREGEDVLGKP